MERKVQEAITKLDEDDRDVILMRYVEQLPNQDVAAALGLSEAAASMRCLRAVRRLQSLLLSSGEESAS
jgi:RNA polymerase sigma-70 factor (ECF subfamily)